MRYIVACCLALGLRSSKRCNKLIFVCFLYFLYHLLETQFCCAAKCIFNVAFCHFTQIIFKARIIQAVRDTIRRQIDIKMGRSACCCNSFSTEEDIRHSTEKAANSKSHN